MIELEAAVLAIRERLAPQTKVERLPLADCEGRITAETVRAPRAVPAFPRAAMDGYGVAASSIVGATAAQPVVLPVVGCLFAGDDPSALQIPPGTAVRVMTGAALPVGVDSVVPQEWTDYGQAQVKLFREIPRGKHYIGIGEDLQAQEAVLAASQYITSESLGVLASIGAATVAVKKKLRVAIIATGSELKVVGTPLAAAEIYNSSAYVLASYIRRSGGEVVWQSICGDDPKQFTQQLQQVALQADLILTTGGVSVGQKDFLPQTFASIGAESLFHFVAFKPGTPVMAAVWEGIPILCLSGNPLATLVDFHLFYWSLLAHFYQAPIFELKKEQQLLLAGEGKRSKLRRFISGYSANGQVTLVPKKPPVARFQQIHHSNCLVEQPPARQLTAGSMVTVYRWFQGR